MKLPLRETAYIPKEKLTDYILSETHADGKLKAKLFRKFGFNEANVSLLEKLLLNIAQPIQYNWVQEKNMFDELDTVVITKDFKEYGLKKGDLGTIVHVYDAKKAFEVEFVAASGRTIALLTLTPKDIRPMSKHEILHARGFAAA